MSVARCPHGQPMHVCTVCIRKFMRDPDPRDASIREFAAEVERLTVAAVMGTAVLVWMREYDLRTPEDVAGSIRATTKTRRDRLAVMLAEALRATNEGR